jgi:hypothetical protein
LKLRFNKRLEHVNLDSSLDAIFGLDQITALCLTCNQISLEKIKSLLRKQRGMKRWEKVAFGRLDQVINDAHISEIGLSNLSPECHPSRKYKSISGTFIKWPKIPKNDLSGRFLQMLEFGKEPWRNKSIHTLSFPFIHYFPFFP